MRKPKRITTFAVETERTFILRSRGALIPPAWCSDCEAEVDMKTVDDAARIIGFGEMSIYRFIEARILHYSEDPAGRVLICSNSLTKLVEAMRSEKY